MCAGVLYVLREGERERERERKREGERERERERKREGERESAKEGGRKREGERESAKEGGRKREGERERERCRICPELIFLFFKGMTGALAPFSYLVSKIASKCDVSGGYDG